MAKPVRFTPRKTEHGWRLNIPPKLSETGKRQQLFYRTQALALQAAAAMKEKLEVFGVQARAIAPSLAERATAAAALLSPYGIDLLEAAKIVVEIRERETASRPIGEAADAWLASCAGLRPRTIRNYTLTADRLKASLPGRIVTTITADELQAAIAPSGTTGAAAAERIRNAKAFWYFSASKGWCQADVFKKVEMPKSGRDSDEIFILSVTETRRLLAAAEEYFPQAVASFALQLFAGIRSEELLRLGPEHITNDGIDLPASVTKKGRRRHITPNATLAAWLKAYPFQQCSNWREVSAACRRMAGWDVAARILHNRISSGSLAAIQNPTLGRWPQNALRHSHASYAIASGVPLENLLFEFGHAGNPTLLRQHYLGRASRKHAIEFFAIGPKGGKIPNIAAA